MKNVKELLLLAFKAGYRRGTQAPADWQGEKTEAEFEDWWAHGVEKLVEMHRG